MVHVDESATLTKETMGTRPKRRVRNGRNRKRDWPTRPRDRKIGLRDASTRGDYGVAEQLVEDTLEIGHRHQRDRRIRSIA